MVPASTRLGSSGPPLSFSSQMGKQDHAGGIGAAPVRVLLAAAVLAVLSFLAITAHIVHGSELGVDSETVRAIHRLVPGSRAAHARGGAAARHLDGTWRRAARQGAAGGRSSGAPGPNLTLKLSLCL